MSDVSNRLDLLTTQYHELMSMIHTLDKQQALYNQNHEYIKKKQQVIEDKISTLNQNFHTMEKSISYLTNSYDNLLSQKKKIFKFVDWCIKHPTIVFAILSLGVFLLVEGGKKLYYMESPLHKQVSTRTQNGFKPDK